MTSRWIKEIQKILNENNKFYEHTLYKELQEVVEKVDKLLKRAAYQVDDELLYEEISKETTNED